MDSKNLHFRPQLHPRTSPQLILRNVLTRLEAILVGEVLLESVSIAVVWMYVTYLPESE